MRTAKTVPYGLSSMEELLELLGITEKRLEETIKLGYLTYKRKQDGKVREIEEPNFELKRMQGRLNSYLQGALKCPKYCQAGFKGQNNIKNAELHRFKREVLTMDISHYFPNTKEEYVRRFFAETFKPTDKVLDILVKLTTYNGHLPTGAPTSLLISNFAHKELFDSIYNKAKELGADMTCYVDDITISTKQHLANSIINFVDGILKTHGLHLKKSKTRRYGFKHAIVTGVHIAQSGKLSAPHKIHYDISVALKKKKIAQMSLYELQHLLAKISYVRQFSPKFMSKTRIKIIKQLKKIDFVRRDKGYRFSPTPNLYKKLMYI